MNFLIFTGILLLRMLTISDSQECGGTYTDPSGSISSPNYPNDYGNNLDCLYYIESPEQRTVSITFVTFSTEPEYDWLQVRCSVGVNFSSPMFSGDILPPPVSVVSCSQVEILFHTDITLVQQGFNLEYQLGDASQSCGGTYTDPSGSISSPNYPSDYSNNLNCLYYIESPQQLAVGITFLSFSTQQCCDWLQVSCSVGADFSSPRYAGTTLPPPLTIVSCSRVEITFYTDSSDVQQGFNLEYELGNDSPTCEEMHTEQSGTISSPNYPSSYENNWNCFYYIEVPQQRTVNITFLTFATQLDYDWLQVTCSVGAPFTSAKFSGSSLPPAISIKWCSTVAIQFLTDGSTVYQGFSLEYVTELHDCGGTYSNQSGSISSPNYPENYDIYTNCLYYIESPRQHSVNIVFLTFATEPSYDWVQVNCSLGAAYSSPRFSGKDLPPSLTIVPCSRAVIQFQSDGTVVDQGFNLAYDIEYGCGGTYGDQTGIISSPNYPDNYANDLNCLYYIEAGTETTVDVTFLAFSTEAIYDWVQVNCSAGLVFSSPRFSGRDVPPPLSVPSCSRVVIQFYTDDEVVGQGFNLAYEIELATL